MTAKEKVAQSKLTMLQLAEQLKNVSEACRMTGYSRQQFYEIKRSFQTYGFEGLIDKDPIPKSMPTKTPPEIEEKVISLSIEHPAFGQQRISDELALIGTQVCAATVRNIWVRHNLETKYKRLLALEEKTATEEFTLTETQIKLLEKHNPALKERHVESAHPGYLLSQDTFYVGRIKGVGRIYLQAVVDTFCSLAFGKLYTSKLPVTAADILYDRVLPFYGAEGVPVLNILTDNGTEFKGKLDSHHYELFLALNDIEHRYCKVATPKTNGFVERFNRTVLDEFFREAFRKKFYASVEELQVDLDEWLTHYNHERPHRGYRNMGRRPYESFTAGKDLIPTEPEKKEVALVS
ncbi:MAG TPA: IS481 family transposase [Candidatus Aquicultor sp.]|jgi:transposase InsO family protein